MKPVSTRADVADDSMFARFRHALTDEPVPADGRCPRCRREISYFDHVYSAWGCQCDDLLLLRRPRGVDPQA
jgi:hypothetical protein